MEAFQINTLHAQRIRNGFCFCWLCSFLSRKEGECLPYVLIIQFQSAPILSLYTSNPNNDASTRYHGVPLSSQWGPGWRKPHYSGGAYSDFQIKVDPPWYEQAGMSTRISEFFFMVRIKIFRLVRVHCCSSLVMWPSLAKTHLILSKHYIINWCNYMLF